MTQELWGESKHITLRPNWSSKTNEIRAMSQTLRVHEVINLILY